MFIDSHSHLTDKKYTDVKDLLEKCEQANVKLLIDVGYDEQSSVDAQKNAYKYDGVYFSAGLHPSEAERSDKDIALIEKLSDDERCVAIGEIGLDYHYEGFNKKNQAELFITQLEIANTKKLPIIIHSRDASGDMYALLKQNASLLTNGFLMHCYSESLEQAQNYLDLGAYFAFGGVITFKNSRKEEIIKSIPLDRILAETDCPYMSPEPFRGTVNVPSNVVYVYKKIATVFDVEVEKIADVFKDNFLRFFKKVRQ